MHRRAHHLALNLTCAAVIAGLAHAAPPESFDLVTPTAPEDIKGGGETCGPATFYEQPLGSFNTARTSDEGSGAPPFEVAEAHLDAGVIAPINATVNQIRVWGIDIDFSGGGAALCAAPEPTAPFTVTFYEDNAGQPGAQVAQVTGIAPVVTETGIPFAFTTIQRYELAISPAVDAGNAAWVSVLRETGPDANCFFLWVDEDDPATYDNFAWQFNGVPESLPTDQTLCIGGMGEPTLALESASATDQCVFEPSNTNGIPEPGDGIFLDVTLEAQNGEQTGIVCELDSTDLDVWVVPGFGASTFPDAAAGTTTTNDSPYAFQIGFSAVCGSTISPTLDCTTDQGTYSLPIDYRIGSSPESAMDVDIPDNDPAGVAVPLQVDRDVTLTDVDVRVDIDHTWVGDVTVELRPPGGGSIALLDRPGVPASGFGCDDNNLRITFDDDATTTAAQLEDLCAGNDPWFSGDAQPVDPLASLAGTSSQGTWELFVVDSAGGDTGQVLEWELITPEPLGICETCFAPGRPFDPDEPQIPTLEGVGLGVLTLLLAGGALFLIRRRS